MSKGRPPKPDALRQRRNRVPGAAQLPSQESARDNEVPPMPANALPWHAGTVEWWESVWRSPMAQEFIDSDVKGGLYMLARLHDAWHRADDAGELVKIAAEIRLQEVRFGLSPIDRTRLRWEIEKGETAAEKTESRRAAKAPRVPKSKDPRGVLKMVG